MFFSGDPSTRKRVDLGGRSSKERDRQKLLEQTRLERNRRLFHRLQNSSATKIQKCFRAWRAVQIEHQKVREQFFSTYGSRCENVDRRCFSPTSKYLRELLFFFNPKNEKDLFALLETCRLLLQYTQDTGDAITLFAGMEYFSNRGLVNYRVKQLTYACIRAVHAYRNQVKTLPYWSQSSSHLSKVLLEAVIKLIDPNLPWSCEIVQYILKRGAFTLLREITLAAEESLKTQNMIDVSSLEHVLMLIIPHDGKRPCVCQNADQWWSFVSQILTVPFLWPIFPCLKEATPDQLLVRMVELAADKHVRYIVSVEKKKDSFESVVMEHLRMNGAYWGLTTLDLLGKLHVVDQDEVISWVMECQHETGGFGGNIGHDPHILYTLSAVQVLALFDKLHILDIDKVSNYVAGLQNEDGSFAGDIWGEVDTRFSYIAICCLSLLRQLNKIDVEKAVNFIVKCKNLDGGFGCTPGGESHAGQIFCCVGALAITGSLHHIDKDLLGWWLCERQVKSGGLNGRPEKLPDVCYSWWVLSSLIIIDRVHWINKEKLAHFILDCQDLDKGGISDRPDDAVDVFHTYFGVAGLSLLEYPGVKAIDPAYALPVDVVNKTKLGS